MLNDGDQPPKWLPKSVMYLSIQQHGVDQLLGAVRVQAKRLSNTVRPETAVDRAKRFEDDSRARADREQLLNREGANAMREQCEAVIAALSAKVKETNQHLSARIAVGRGSTGWFVVRAKNVSLSLTADQAHPTTNSRIIVQEWKGALSLATEGVVHFSPQPKRIAETSFYFDATINSRLQPLCAILGKPFL